MDANSEHSDTQDAITWMQGQLALSSFCLGVAVVLLSQDKGAKKEEFVVTLLRKILDEAEAGGVPPEYSDLFNDGVNHFKKNLLQTIDSLSEKMKNK